MGSPHPRFAPAFDNGTSLAHEITDLNISKFDDDRVDSYVKRGRHHMKLNRDDDRAIKHIEILQTLYLLRKHSRLEARTVLQKDFSPFFAWLRSLPEVEISVPMTEARANLIERMINRRLGLLREVSNV